MILKQKISVQIYLIYALIFHIFHSCTGIKVIGDPVDGIRYKQGDYDINLKRVISLELKNDEILSIPESIDTVDVDTKGGKTPPNTPTREGLGFDLISLTSARGHFVDKVRKYTLQIF